MSEGMGARKQAHSCTDADVANRCGVWSLDAWYQCKFVVHAVVGQYASTKPVNSQRESR